MSKSCKQCGKEFIKSKLFCSRKCSALYRSDNILLIDKDLLHKQYVEDDLSLLEISLYHKCSINTVCKYVKKYKFKNKIKYIDFSNTRIGRLQIIKPVFTEDDVKNGKHVKWQCVCDCGNEYFAWSHHLSRSKSIQCTICSNKNRRSKLELKNYIWTNYSRSAKSRNIDFLIEREWAYELFLKQDRKCALSGIDIAFAESAYEYNKGKNTASLDRIDSKKPYTQDNVQWVHKDVNHIKMAFDQNYFIEICRKIAEYNPPIKH